MAYTKIGREDVTSEHPKTEEIADRLRDEDVAVKALREYEVSQIVVWWDNERNSWYCYVTNPVPEHEEDERDEEREVTDAGDMSESAFWGTLQNCVTGEYEYEFVDMSETRVQEVA
jgi:hypothetical protein